MFECDLECVSIARARLIRGKAFVIRGRRTAKQRAQSAELSVVANRKEQIDSAGSICVVRG